MSWTFTETSDIDEDTIFNYKVLEDWIKTNKPREKLILLGATQQIIDAIPDNVEYLCISSSDLEYFTKFPKNLKVLICDTCFYLKEIRNLPPTIQYIDCKMSYMLNSIILPEGVKPKIRSKHTRLHLQDEHNIEDKLNHRINKWIKDNKPYNILDLSLLNLQNIPKLPDNVEWLKIGGNPIRELNNLPPNLKRLECQGTRIRDLNNLPKSIEYINCSYSIYLDSIDNLPNNVKKLYATRINIKKINVLPSNLKELYITRCEDLEEICKLPDNLRVLCIISTGLKVLPKLPETLKKLIILENNNTAIGNLPSNLRYLHIEDTAISEETSKYIDNIIETLIYLNIDSGLYKKYNMELDPTGYETEFNTIDENKILYMNNLYYLTLMDSEDE